MPAVLIEKWALVEVDTDDEAEAVARVAAMDAEGSIEFRQAISLDGEGSPASKMETALRLIATIHMTEGSDEKRLAEVQQIAKRAIPDVVVERERFLTPSERQERQTLLNLAVSQRLANMATAGCEHQRPRNCLLHGPVGWVRIVPGHSGSVAAEIEWQQEKPERAGLWRAIYLKTPNDLGNRPPREAVKET